jgi:hypothetical protein
LLDDTRPPERQRLSLCKGKAEREPANLRGSREFYQGIHFVADQVGGANAAAGSKRAIHQAGSRSLLINPRAREIK